MANLIARLPATNLNGLAVKFDAIWWWLEQDDSVLDAAATRWLRRFGLALRRLA
ncbi:MAG: hypothetical protein ABIY37_04110 [Devosia sp.]